MDKALLDLYTDYLISSFSYTTATGLSQLLDHALSHDQITRFLSQRPRTSADLWQIVKPVVRHVERDEGVLIVDDSIEEKPYTDENDLIAWHYDHSKDRSVKGINFLTALYQTGAVSLPVAFDLVTKTEIVIDKKTGKPRRKSTQTKNERYRQMLKACARNQLKFGYVLNDAWYSSADNMKFVRHELHKEFIMPLKSNRKVALTLADKQRGAYVAVEALATQEGVMQEVYLEAVDFPLLFAKQVFTFDDRTTGTLYLVASDLTLTYEEVTTLYQRRWRVEEYHKSLKQNASLAKSPTRTVTTQTNHFFAAVCAFVKLERLKVKTKLNHFAIKSKIYVSALQTAYEELQSLGPKPLVIAACA
ncbi:MAG: transposase [Acidobacteria bacterium]|nr:transposase [Acidobacteriota bacterium]